MFVYPLFTEVKWHEVFRVSEEYLEELENVPLPTVE